MNPIEIISKREELYQSIANNEKDASAKAKINQDIERIQSIKKVLAKFGS